MLAMLPEMFPSFDDRIEEIQSVQKSLSSISKDFIEGGFPISEILELGIPLIPRTDEKNYSPRQIKVQEWLKKNPRYVRRFLVAPSIPPSVKVPIALTTAFIAVGTGGRGPSMRTPEIQRYEESAFASGVGGFSII